MLADYTRRIPPSLLKANGITEVMRYLSWMFYWDGKSNNYPNPKVILQPEYDELKSADIPVTLNWEFDARDWMSGAQGGKDHASEAIRQAKRLGYPEGSIIVGSADFDMSLSEWNAAGESYAKTFKETLLAGGYVPGVYGPFSVLTWVQQEVGYSLYIQAGMATAWSGGINGLPWPDADYIQSYQTTIGSQTIDISIGHRKETFMRDATFYRNPNDGTVILRMGFFYYIIPGSENDVLLKSIQSLVDLAGGNSTLVPCTPEAWTVINLGVNIATVKDLFLGPTAQDIATEIIRQLRP